MTRKVDFPQVGGFGDGGSVEADPVDEVTPPAVEDVLGEDQPVPIAQVAGQAVPELEVLGFLRQQILTALSPAHGIVQVGVGGHADGASGGGEGHGTAGLVDAQGQGGLGNKAGPIRRGIEVPRGEGAGSEASKFDALSDPEVEVGPTVAQRVDAAVAPAVVRNAEPVAHHAFPAEVGGDQGFPPVGDPTGATAGAGYGGHVLVGALVPSRHRPIVRSQDTVGVFDVVPFSFAEELEPVAVVAVVYAGFYIPAPEFVLPGQLSLPEAHPLELLGEVGRVEVLGAKGGGHASNAEVERALVGDGASGVAGAGHFQIGVVAEPVCRRTADADAMAGLALAPIVAGPDAVPTVGPRLHGDGGLIRIAGTGMQHDAAGDATAAEGAASAADDLHALNVLRIDGQVQQVVGRVGCAPADAVDP